tara:strand:- start:749 stop:1018 length:270 start_codon:yes stop_codon:yes gene_type:complete
MILQELQTEPLNLAQRKKLVIKAIESAVQYGYDIEPFLKHFKNYSYNRWNTFFLLEVIQDNFKSQYDGEEDATKELNNFLQELEQLKKI